MDAAPKLFTIPQFCKRNPWWTEAALRQRVWRDAAFQRACVRRIGRKVLIDEDALLCWLDAQSEGGADRG